MNLPDATPKPCSDCPWRRNAVKGWLGPMTPEEWIQAAHSDVPIACHQTIKEANEEGVGNWEHPALRQCRGAASFRSHICKLPRDPGIETGPADPNVFSTNQEFLDYHKPMHDEYYEPLRKEKD